MGDIASIFIIFGHESFSLLPSLRQAANVRFSPYPPSIIVTGSLLHFMFKDDI